MQRLQNLLASRGGKFDGEVREIMILVELGVDRQDMVGVWGMRDVGQNNFLQIMTAHLVTKEKSNYCSNLQ